MSTVTAPFDFDTDDRPITLDDPTLVGRTVVVTGGGRGMGATFVTELAARGVNVVAVDLREELLAAVAGTTPGGGVVVPIVGDVTDPDTHQRAVDAAVAATGRLDGYVNNAGIWASTPGIEVTPEEITRLYDVNVNGVLYGCQAAARHMREHGGGSIVTISSLAAIRARKGGASYHSSKAAVRHLLNVLTLELGEHGIRVNSLAPGYVDTDLMNWARNPDEYARCIDGVPLRRIGAQQEIFGPLLFLLSDASRYLSGVTIPVDGGRRWM